MRNGGVSCTWRSALSDRCASCCQGRVHDVLCVAQKQSGGVPIATGPVSRNEASYRSEWIARSVGDAEVSADEHIHYPSLSTLLDSAEVPHVPLNATWEDYRFKPFLQIHSSGSTGIPKLITLNHGSFTAFDSFRLLETNEVFRRLGSQRMCVSFPPFHVAGIVYGLAFPCWVDSTVIIPPTAALTADLVNEVLVESQAEYTLLPPSIVTDLAKNPKYLQNLSRLRGVTFAGGPLSGATGKLIVECTKLNVGYGASEWMAVPQLPKDDEDWPYSISMRDKVGWSSASETKTCTRWSLSGILSFTLHNQSSSTSPTSTSSLPKTSLHLIRRSLPCGSTSLAGMI